MIPGSWNPKKYSPASCSTSTIASRSWVWRFSASRNEFLPRIWEAIDEGAWDEIPGYENELVAAFESAAALADEASALLER